MNTNTILVILGEPNSTFSEILIKYFNSKEFVKNKNKIVLIGSKKLFESQCKILKSKIKLNEIFHAQDSKKNLVNIINVNYNFKKAYSKIKRYSKKYIEECFSLSLRIIKENKKFFLINGPVSKKEFLNKKYLGITEYVAFKTSSKNPVMLIYNKKLAVSPLTTHIPINSVAKNIKRKKIISNIKKINNFYKNQIGKIPKIAVLGLNPHCESIDKVSEETKEIIPAIKSLIKKKIYVDGPIAADTFFIEKNIKKYDVVIGMYHDQVLTPLKALYKFNAINVTIGLPFIKITPDHGPNYQMIGKNKSDPSSIFCAFDFFNKLRR